MHIYIYIYMYRQVKNNRQSGSSARRRSGEATSSFAGFQTGSGQTRFSQKGHISLRFNYFALSAHMLPHVVTFSSSLPCVGTLCTNFPVTIH